MRSRAEFIRKSAPILNYLSTLTELGHASYVCLEEIESEPMFELFRGRLKVPIRKYRGHTGPDANSRASPRHGNAGSRPWRGTLVGFRKDRGGWSESACG